MPHSAQGRTRSATATSGCGQRGKPLRRLLQQVKGQPLGGLAPDAGELGEFGDEIVERRPRLRAAESSGSERHLPHLGLERLCRPALALGDRRQDQVGQQLRVPSLERGGIDRAGARTVPRPSTVTRTIPPPAWTSMV